MIKFSRWLTVSRPTCQISFERKSHSYAHAEISCVQRATHFPEIPWRDDVDSKNRWENIGRRWQTYVWYRNSLEDVDLSKRILKLTPSSKNPTSSKPNLCGSHVFQRLPAFGPWRFFAPMLVSLSSSYVFSRDSLARRRGEQSRWENF